MGTVTVTLIVKNLDVDDYIDRLLNQNGSIERFSSNVVECVSWMWVETRATRKLERRPSSKTPNSLVAL